MILGCAHAKGLYTVPGGSGTQFMDGVSAIEATGCKCLKVYCTPSYASDYPLEASWSSTPASCKQLVQTSEFQAALAKPFDRVVLTTFTFANGGTNWWRVDPSNARLDAEYAEIYELACHLLSAYSGTGKTFVLQNWEGDWAFMDSFVVDTPVPRQYVDFYSAFLGARQRAVQDARKNAAHSNVTVLSAVEVNRVLDSRASPHLRRILRDIAPRLIPDVVSYSAYDSTIVFPPVGWSGTYSQWVASCTKYFTRALRQIKAAWPGVPVQIGEFGFPENEAPSGFDVGAMIQVVHDIAESEGVEAFIYWQVFDNEVGSGGPGTYRGYWFTRPDGTMSTAGAKFESL